MTAPWLLLGSSMTLEEAVVQCGGKAWRMSADALRQMVDQDAELRRHMLAYIGEMLRQLLDTTWYTGHAPIVSRVARWLLQATQRLGSDAVKITHENLADVLGVRRSGVTVALHELEGKMLIRACRGTIKIRDRSGLALAAEHHEAMGCTSTNYRWQASQSCHPERSEGPLGPNDLCTLALADSAQFGMSYASTLKPVQSRPTFRDVEGTTASFRAHLSPNEETTLLRIAAGTPNRDGLRKSDIERLVALGLVDEIDGGLTATKVGLERCQGGTSLTPRPVARRRRLKTRQLPL